MALLLLGPDRHIILIGITRFLFPACQKKLLSILFCNLKLPKMKVLLFVYHSHINQIHSALVLPHIFPLVVQTAPCSVCPPVREAQGANLNEIE